MNARDIISLVSAVISFIGFVYVYFKGVVESRERLARLETKVEVFWKSVALDAAKILHTPHPENARRDDLLEKFTDGSITREELEELIRTLNKIVEEKHREFGERTAASTLLRAIEIQYEI